MKATLKTFGSILIGIAVILLFLLTFMKIDNDRKSIVLCEKYHETEENMQECPVHKSSFSWMIIVAYGIGIIMLLIGVYLLFIPQQTEKEESREFKEVDISKLDDEEKRVYEIIKNKEGSAFQSDLLKETGFSKVKITRILDKLELKGVLDRKRRGMTNIIVLK